MFNRFSLPSSATILAVGLAIVVALAYINDLVWTVKYSTLEKTYAEEKAAQANAITAAVEKVRELERQGDEIAARVITAEAERKQLAKERDDAIKKLTTGHPCLAAPVVRLLNDPSAPGAGFRLPASAADAVDADSAFATDTDVGTWAASARDAHDSCRARIDALREFFKLEAKP